MFSLNRLKHLAIMLGNIRPHSKPKVHLEQYTLGCDEAARILWYAGRVNNDIYGKIVMDLGCGTGILAIGAVLLGAKHVIGVDVDPEALEIALDNAKNIGVYSKISFVCAEVPNIPIYKKVDTVIQNPPFGVHKKGADTMFLETALNNANVVYSLHKYTIENDLFLSNFINSIGCRIADSILLTVNIPHMFDFHKEFKRKVNVILYKIIH